MYTVDNLHCVTLSHLAQENNTIVVIFACGLLDRMKREAADIAESEPSEEHDEIKKKDQEIEELRKKILVAEDYRRDMEAGIINISFFIFFHFGIWRALLHEKGQGTSARSCQERLGAEAHQSEVSWTARTDGCHDWYNYRRNCLWKAWASIARSRTLGSDRLARSQRSAVGLATNKCAGT